MDYGGYDLIYLEPDVQLNRVVDRIGESTSDSLAFVVHQRSPLLYSKMNLDLMKKRLREEEKEGVFVTSHPQLIKILKRDGWTVYSSLEELEGCSLPKGEILEIYREDEKYQTRPGKQKKGRRLFFLLLFLLFGFSALFYLHMTAVVIEITPTRKVSTQSMVFSGDFEGNSVSLEEGLLPLKSYTFFRELVKDFPATGREVVGVDFSRGRVRFINNGMETVFVSKGTILEAQNGAQFVTIEDVRVPSANLKYLLDVVVERKAGWAEVQVQAMERGSMGNVQAGHIREWLLEDEEVLVINPERTSGGRDEEISVITARDLEEGNASLRGALFRLAQEEIQEVVGPEHLLIQELEGQYQLHIESSKEVMEEGAYFYLTGKIEGEIIYLQKEELQYLVAKTFLKDLSLGYNVSQEPLQIEDIYIEGSLGDHFNIYLTITGEVIAHINSQDLENSFKGVSVDVARNVLRTMPEVDSFRISGQDRRRLPPFTMGLRVVVED